MKKLLDKIFKLKKKTYIIKFHVNKDMIDGIDFSNKEVIDNLTRKQLYAYYRSDELNELLTRIFGFSNYKIDYCNTNNAIVLMIKTSKEELVDRAVYLLRNQLLYIIDDVQSY